MNFGVDLFWPAYAALLLAAAALAAHVMAYRRTTPPVSSAARRFLLAIRITTVALIVFTLWRPAAESRRKLERKGRLALLVDASASMSIGDESSEESGAGISRLRRAGRVFAENRALWRKITDSASVEAYSFAGDTAPLAVEPEKLPDEPTFGLTPDGELTALGEALRTVAAAPAPQAVLVLSDGLSNSGLAPLDAAAGAPPVYAVSVGSERPGPTTRDVAVTGVFAPSRVFRGAEMTVLGEFSLTGLAGREVEVSLYAAGGKQDSKTIRAESEREIVEARFSCTPRETGPLHLEVRAEPLADEIVAVNNDAATYVDVRPGGLEVVFLEGGFRWEAKFLRQALESLKDVQVRFIVPLGGDRAAVSEALEGDWDVLILGSIAASRIPEAAAETVRRAVGEEGRGLLFTAGPDALGRGGYGSGALAALSPFELHEDEKFDACLWVPEPEVRGPHGDIVTFGPERTAQPWKSATPLLALNLVGAARPGASVLLKALPKKRDEESGELIPCPLRTEAPLFAVQEFGAGRTAAFAGEGTWQWVMGSGITDEARRQQAAALHARFWRQVLFWLARREQSGEMTLDLDLDRHRVAVGEKVGLGARLFDRRMEPLTNARLEARITCEGIDEKRTFWVEGSGYRADFEPPAAGDYSVTVTAFLDGAEAARAETAFVATGTDAEFSTLVARPRLLASLALATGGRYAAADDAGYVFSEIAESTGSSVYMRLTRREMWSSWYYLALILALLTLEWGLRKLAGLI